jgi:hypothetical protein
VGGVRVQLSPDGKWWWDGVGWRPVVPPPEQPGYSAPQQFAGQSAPYGGQQPCGGQQPYRPRRRGPWLAALAVLAAAAIAVPIAILAGGHDRNSGRSGQGDAPSKSSAPSVTLTPGQPVTQSVLDHMAPDDFLWQVLQRQMTRPVQAITSVYFRTSKELAEHSGLYVVSRFGLDRRSGESTFGTDAYSAGKLDAMSRCVKGKGYYRALDHDRGWNPNSAAEKDCQPNAILPLKSADDDIVANGMTAEQAGKVVEALRDPHPGFVNPRKPGVVSVKGQPLIRQVVDFIPQQLEDGHYWGNMLLDQAFAASGLDRKAWHWVEDWSGAAGLHVVYYINPSTLLPAVGLQSKTAGFDDSGKPGSADGASLLINYEFPDSVPLEKLGAKPYPLLLPAGWAVK